MGWFWRHKVVSLILAAAIAYWFLNPAKRFGYSSSNLVIYNRIPIALFDIYVGPSGKIFIEDNLAKPSTLRYWLENQLPSDFPDNSPFSLIIGTGFGPPSIALDRQTIDALRKHRISLSQLPSAEAIARYNASCDSGKATAILLKIK